jgi:hypothetical protein
MKKKSWQFSFYNNMMMYIKINLFFYISPTYDQFIMK